MTLVKMASGNDSLDVPLHPLMIKPAGNAYAATAIKENIKSAAGIFSAVPDELLVQIIECLDGESLQRLGSTCKALYAFTRLDELWKQFCIEYECPSY